MIKENFLRRILYIGAGLIILVAALLILLVIPCIILDKSLTSTPVNAVIGTFLNVILHLLPLYVFREAIIVNKRNGLLKNKNILFIASGIGLLLLGLMLMDGAIAYMEDGAIVFMGHDNMHLASISMFICAGCDFFAAVIAFTALFLLPKKTDIK